MGVTNRKCQTDELENERWSRVRDRAEDDGERLDAACNLAASLSDEGKHAEAEKLEREELAVRKRVLWEPSVGVGIPKR